MSNRHRVEVDSWRDPKIDGTRKIINEVKALEFGWVVHLATTSWEPSMEFAVSDEAYPDDRVRLVSGSGRPYYLTVERIDKYDSRVVRLRDQDNQSHGIVTYLEAVGDVGGSAQEKWEEVWT